MMRHLGWFLAMVISGIVLPALALFALGFLAKLGWMLIKLGWSLV